METVSFTSNAIGLFSPSKTIITPAMTPGNLLIGIAQSNRSRAMASITGGAVWDVTASRLHDFAGGYGRIQVHAAICTIPDTTFTMRLAGNSNNPDRLSLIEVTLPLNPMSEIGISTQNNNPRGVPHVCGVVSPTSGPVYFVVVGTFNRNPGTLTSDSDFLTQVQTGAHIVGSRAQSDGIPQGYNAVGSILAASSFVLVCVQGVTGGSIENPVYPFVNCVGTA